VTKHYIVHPFEDIFPAHLPTSNRTVIRPKPAKPGEVEAFSLKYEHLNTMQQ